jgi:trk system potassium uptake protein TrkH
VVAAGSTVLVAFSLCRDSGCSVLQGLRQALFGVVTTFSTTGYSLVDYSDWPAFGLGVLAVLMLIGGCTGSTAGGIKMIRAYLLVRITALNMERRVNPNCWVIAPTYTHRKNSVPIDERCKEDVLGFVMVYLATLVVGILLMTLFSGSSLSDAAFEFTSALGTVGLSNGLTSPNAPTAQLFLEMFAMVLGRLEILMVFMGLYSIKSLFVR